MQRTLAGLAESEFSGGQFLLRRETEMAETVSAT